MKPTLEELNKKLDEKTNESIRIQIAVFLDICPECGAELIEVEESYIMGKWIFKTKESRTIKKCKENELHYSKIIHDSYFESDEGYSCG